MLHRFPDRFDEPMIPTNAKVLRASYARLMADDPLGPTVAGPIDVA